MPVAALAEEDIAPVLDEEAEVTPESEPTAEPSETPEPEEPFSAMVTAPDGDTGTIELTMSKLDEHKTDSVAGEELTYHYYTLPTGSYILTETIVYSGQVTIEDGAEVTIDLNDHDLTQDVPSFSPYCGIVVNSSLTLKGNGTYTAAQKPPRSLNTRASMWLLALPSHCRTAQ